MGQNGESNPKSVRQPADHSPLVEVVEPDTGLDRQGGERKPAGRRGGAGEIFFGRGAPAYGSAFWTARRA